MRLTVSCSSRLARLLQLLPAHFSRGAALGQRGHIVGFGVGFVCLMIITFSSLHAHCLSFMHPGTEPPLVHLGTECEVLLGVK